MIKLINKLLSILLITLLVIQPLSGSITIFQNIEYSTQNKDLEKVKNVAFDYIGHTLYKDMENPIIPVTVTHGILGGALSELAGGDFSQGAISSVTSHLVAEYYLNSKIEALQNGTNTSVLSHEQFMAITDAIGGAIVLATHENVTDKELEIAQNVSHSVVENNVLPVVIAIESVAGSMTSSGLAVLGGAIASLGAVAVYNIIKENPSNITEALNIAMEQVNIDIKRPADIPDDWIERESDNGGKVWEDPKNPKHNNTRVEPGGKNQKYPKSYRKDLRDGQYKDKDGNTVPKNSPEAHQDVEIK